ncbi:uncharacterized protein Z519_06912 [Cladophialophora bantiana CBS 173.52]|uniref:SWIM-type domain-containing protein n=1 Tax=Cladophialophora bantiana (strain ATCC 10958 / CBS 173.52 / CDC B-1940 / NIH 8579) TaxID=1442370 RepID=A0A0D2G322_CLAB1|nr:uncharacterized protein Z519_06912 [Cladophialophora bantiana CBS 173.52]KIW93062.1 hypothetical protein Z519_06912 [Cladophialophora bantiana CBS 173.52]
MTSNQSQTSLLNAILKTLSHLSEVKASQQDNQVPTHLPNYPQHASHNGIQALPISDRDRARSVFLTLHALFPHELLPALDLLDRGLVTKLVVELAALRIDDQGMAKGRGSVDEDRSVLECSDLQLQLQSNGKSWGTFYIQSSSTTDRPTSTRQFHSRRGNTSTTGPIYEVSLDSWNCTCPAFSVSVFQSLNLRFNQDFGANEDDVVGRVGDSKRKMKDDWKFGGTATIKMGRVPSCKHLMAATLAKVAPSLFTDGVKETIVSREEVVAWGGGWGEHVSP